MRMRPRDPRASHTGGARTRGLNVSPGVTLEAAIGLIVNLIVAGVAERLATPRVAERIPLADVVDHGAPSSRWVTDRARDGQIQIRGPRGGRYVIAVELFALLAKTTIARRERMAPAAPTTLEDDARAAVVDLSARRSRRTA